MSVAPVIIDVPHQLGRDGARERLRSRIGELDRHLPPGIGKAQARWTGDYELTLELTAMTQAVTARLEVLDQVVRVHLMLPPMLGFFAGMIGAAVREQGTKLLK